MVSSVNPFSDVTRRWKQAQKDNARLEEIARQGFISQRLKDYSVRLLLMNCLAEEAKTYAETSDYDEAVKSLVEMRHWLDCVDAILLANGRLETEPIGNGLCAIKNPDLNNVKKYQVLYDFAQDVYNEAIENVESILGAVA